MGWLWFKVADWATKPEPARAEALDVEVPEPKAIMPHVPPVFELVVT